MSRPEYATVVVMGWYCDDCNMHEPCNCGKATLLRIEYEKKMIEEEMEWKRIEEEKAQQGWHPSCNDPSCWRCKKDEKQEENDPPPEIYVYEEIQEPILPQQDTSIIEYDSIDQVDQKPTTITRAQKKAILVISIGAMGLFAVIFIVAIIMKRKRKALEKARDAIIVETSLIPISDKKVGGVDEEKGRYVFEDEKGVVFSDEKKLAVDGSIPVNSHTSEKEFKN